MLFSCVLLFFGINQTQRCVGISAVVTKLNALTRSGIEVKCFFNLKASKVVLSRTCMFIESNITTEIDLLRHILKCYNFSYIICSLNMELYQRNEKARDLHILPVLIYQLRKKCSTSRIMYIVEW